MPADPKHSSPSHLQKAHTAIKPYVHTEPTRVPAKNAPKTSAVPVAENQVCSNLILYGWTIVVVYCNDHPSLKQKELVEYFQTQTEGALIFNQASLSHHLSKAGHAMDKARLHTTPAALNGKRIQAVTQPDVEKALYLWTMHMEEKKEHYSGAMLMAR